MRCPGPYPRVHYNIDSLEAILRSVGGEGEQMMILALWPHGLTEGLRNDACQGIASVCPVDHYTGASL
jgi:hypothetical protein